MRMAHAWRIGVSTNTPDGRRGTPAKGANDRRGPRAGVTNSRATIRIEVEPDGIGPGVPRRSGAVIRAS